MSDFSSIYWDSSATDHSEVWNDDGQHRDYSEINLDQLDDGSRTESENNFYPHHQDFVDLDRAHGRHYRPNIERYYSNHDLFDDDASNNDSLDMYHHIPRHNNKQYYRNSQHRYHEQPTFVPRRYKPKAADIIERMTGRRRPRVRKRSSSMEEWNHRSPPRRSPPPHRSSRHHNSELLHYSRSPRRYRSRADMMEQIIGHKRPKVRKITSSIEKWRRSKNRHSSRRGDGLRRKRSVQVQTDPWVENPIHEESEEETVSISEMEITDSDLEDSLLLLDRAGTKGPASVTFREDTFSTPKSERKEVHWKEQHYDVTNEGGGRASKTNKPNFSFIDDNLSKLRPSYFKEKELLDANTSRWKKDKYSPEERQQREVGKEIRVARQHPSKSSNFWQLPKSCWPNKMTSRQQSSERPRVDSSRAHRSGILKDYSPTSVNQTQQHSSAESMTFLEKIADTLLMKIPPGLFNESQNCSDADCRSCKRGRKRVK